MKRGVNTKRRETDPNNIPKPKAEKKYQLPLDFEYKHKGQW